MALPTPTGLLDEVNGIITSPNTGTWADIGAGTDFPTWDDWKTFNTTPGSLTWLTEELDLGESVYFNLEVDVEAQGTVSYTVYTSTTGAFAGEEVSTAISAGDTNITAFYGRYAVVLITVAPAGGSTPVLQEVSLRASSERFSILKYDLDTTTLTGTTSGGFTIDPGRSVSKILSMRITPQQPGPYFEADYVADDYVATSNPAYPAIASKTNTAPKVVFTTDGGAYTDSIFDIELQCLPEMYVNETGNLHIR